MTLNQGRLVQWEGEGDCGRESAGEVSVGGTREVLGGEGGRDGVCRWESVGGCGSVWVGRVSVTAQNSQESLHTLAGEG
jgi:hypothetical protein